MGVKVGGRGAATYSIDLFQSSAALFSAPELESVWIEHMAVLGGICIGMLCSQVLQNFLVLDYKDLKRRRCFQCTKLKVDCCFSYTTESLKLKGQDLFCC